MNKREIVTITTLGVLLPLLNFTVLLLPIMLIWATMLYIKGAVLGINLLSPEIFAQQPTVQVLITVGIFTEWIFAWILWTKVLTKTILKHDG